MVDNSIPKDPLQTLIGSKQELDRGLLLKMLQGNIMIDSDSGRPTPLPPFTTLTGRQQVVMLLLGGKAAHALGKRENESMTAKELAELSGVNYNSIRVHLSKLETEKFIGKSKAEYFIPSYNLLRIKTEVLNHDE